MKLCRCIDQLKTGVRANYINCIYARSRALIVNSHIMTVCQSEEHYQQFKESPVGDKGCLMFIPFLYADIVVPPSDVRLCENTCMVQLVDNF